MYDALYYGSSLNVGPELARVRYVEMLSGNEPRMLARQVLQSERERKRFYRLYMLRHICFRLAPRWAERFVL